MYYIVSIIVYVKGVYINGFVLFFVLYLFDDLILFVIYNEVFEVLFVEF